MQHAFVPIIHLIGPYLSTKTPDSFAVQRLITLSPLFCLFDLYTLGYGCAKIWWARPELNWRSSPCQGDVITPRPRALEWIVNSTVFGWFVYQRSNHPTIFEILPVQPGCEQMPPTRLRPFPIVWCFTSLIGPYILHLRQNPSYCAMLSFLWIAYQIWTIRKLNQLMK